MTFFSWFMRFVRVPPYENWAFWTNFYFSWETVNFFGVKHVAPSSTLKMRKSHKKSARVYAYTHAYTQLRDGGGRSTPPHPESNRVNDVSKNCKASCKWSLRIPTAEKKSISFVHRDSLCQILTWVTFLKRWPPEVFARVDKLAGNGARMDGV